jgi:cytochrome c551/c552
MASQNVSSNVGQVTIRGASTQVTALLGSYVGNVAHANAMAVQNLASNNGCVICDGGTTVGGHGR